MRMFFRDDRSQYLEFTGQDWIFGCFIFFKFLPGRIEAVFCSNRNNDGIFFFIFFNILCAFDKNNLFKPAGNKCENKANTVKNKNVDRIPLGLGQQVAGDDFQEKRNSQGGGNSQ